MSELQENTNKIENMSKNEILKNIEELNVQYKVLLEKEVLLNQEMSELQENVNIINNKLLKLMKLRKFYYDTEQKLQEIYEKYENKQKLENIIILYYEILK